MKKTRRLLCMSLAVVMLLGAIPAYAATPMTAAASLIALPLSGKLFTALPVSDNISKALTVKEIESTYSTEAKSAPTSAPVEQTTFATTANPAPTTRLPDGTTGATVGLVGKTTGITYDELKAVYPGSVGICGVARTEWKVENRWKVLDGPNARKNYTSGTVAFLYDASRKSRNDLIGQAIPAGWLVDVYEKHDHKYDFVCQYDTRDGSPLTITVAPGASANKPMLMTAATTVPTSFNDVKTDDWYYEAVTALANGNVIHTVFDIDPSGNFNPNALVTRGEAEFIRNRLRGKDTEGLVMSNADNDDYRAGGTRYNIAITIAGFHKYLQSPAATAQVALTDADARAIDAFADMCAKDNNRNFGWKYADAYAKIRTELRTAYGLGAVRTPGTPAAIDFDARVTRAEYCVMLYNAGLTSFGCCAPK